MKILSNTETQTVAGGNALLSFLVGYGAGKVLDVSIDSFKNHVIAFSEQDHSASNQYFLNNREQFNLLY
ncbi:hypothetical protein NLG07_05500 [Alteromonas sp. LMIT006]|uniref:hypothetical protein n=1 Tax=Alteromonadaceae TaxID=72275 RepID=UPI0020CA6AB3|nr:hypothetical protein [Alteromonas sp. LMIT006]UTP73690.1 hypothetical protein NLG07_05500 [Alteromonas sp. LMIT006]